MSNSKKSRAVAVAGPRPTRCAAFLVASALSVPVFVLLTLIDWLV